MITPSSESVNYRIHTGWEETKKIKDFANMKPSWSVKFFFIGGSQLFATDHFGFIFFYTGVYLNAYFALYSYSSHPKMIEKFDFASMGQIFVRQ